MKKILFSLIAVLGLFSACSNDDIEILSTNATTIKVATQNVYDSYGSTKAIAERFLADGKDYSLGVFTYVYDAEGKRVASKKDYINNFLTVSNEFNLPYGEYTVITLQTLVTKDKHEMESYKMVGEDNLKTLEIKTTSSYIFWYEAVGMASQKVTINEKSLTHNMVNKPIGSRVDCDFHNFDQSNNAYDMGLFATKERALGRYLSPEYTGKDRFEWDGLNQKNTWYIRGFAWTSPCLKAQEGFDVYMLEEGDFTYNLSPSHTVEENGETHFGKWTSYPSADAKFTCRDGQRLFGGCYYLGNSNPECSAGVFATEAEYNNWFQAAEQGYTLPDQPTPGESQWIPYISWGASASSINSKVTSLGLSYVSGSLTDDNENWMDIYANEDASIAWGYIFDTNKKNLNQIMSIYSKLSATAVAEGLAANGYEMFGYDEELGGNLGASDNSIVLVSEIDGETVCVFVPNDNNAPHRSSVKASVPSAKQLRALYKSIKK